MIMRKNSEANGGDAGAETQSVLMSVFRTLKQCGYNPILAVLDAIRTDLKSGNRPSLPPKIAGIG